MNDGLIRALATALYYCKHYEDSNPDVGMGPFLETLAERVLRTAQIEASEQNISLVVQAYKLRWKDE